MSKKQGYFKEVWLAVSQLLHTLTGGRSDVTFSSEMYVESQMGKRRGKIGRWIVNAIFFWQRDHCRGAWANEKKTIKEAGEYLDSVESDVLRPDGQG